MVTLLFREPEHSLLKELQCNASDRDTYQKLTTVIMLYNKLSQEFIAGDAWGGLPTCFLFPWFVCRFLLQWLRRCSGNVFLIACVAFAGHPPGALLHGTCPYHQPCIREGVPAKFLGCTTHIATDGLYGSR